MESDDKHLRRSSDLLVHTVTYSHLLSLLTHMNTHAYLIYTNKIFLKKMKNSLAPALLTPHIAEPISSSPSNRRQDFKSTSHLILDHLYCPGMPLASLVLKVGTMVFPTSWGLLRTH